jgi:protein TonB
MNRTHAAGFAVAATLGLLLARPATAAAQTTAADTTPAAVAGADAGYQPPELLNADELPGLKASYYPTLLRDAGVTGEVRMRIAIDSLGRVRHARVLYAGHDMFADAAREIVRKLRFRPAMEGGRPVASELAFPIEFQLDASGQPPLHEP